MKIYLKDFYAKSEENFIYKIVSLEVNENSNIIDINLELIAGWDYISEEKDIQGYVPSDRFVEDVQTLSLCQNILREGMFEALSEYNFTIIDDINKLPKIHY